MALEGLNQVLANLNREVRRIEGRTERGVYLAAEAIRSEAIPMTPVDLGPLRASAKATSGMTLDGPIAVVSYNTEYAVVQHEDLSFHHDVGEAKFLEKAANRNRTRAVEIIGREARV